MFSFVVSLYFLHTELCCEKILHFLGRVSTKYAKKICQNFACLYIIQIPGLLISLKPVCFLGEQRS